MHFLESSRRKSTLLEILKILLEHGASVDGKTTSVHRVHLPPKHVLYQDFGRHSKVQSSAIQIFYQTFLKPMYFYTLIGRVWAALPLLCAHGANINEVVDGDKSMLLCVVREGNLSDTLALLENGADINAVTTKGESALFLCLLSSYSKCIFKCNLD